MKRTFLLAGVLAAGLVTQHTAALSAPPDAPVPPVEKLQRYQVDPAKIFVAGISSGGFAAVQMHVAHSSTFKGAAIYAAGVYWCAGAGGAATALANCGGQTLPTGQASYNSMLAPSQTYLETQSALGTIDPMSNLRGQPVYLWSGTKDATVHPLAMADLNAEYLRYGADVRFDNTSPRPTAGSRPTVSSTAAPPAARSWCDAHATASFTTRSRPGSRCSWVRWRRATTESSREA